MFECANPPKRPTTVLLHVVLRPFTLIRSQMKLCSDKTGLSLIWSLTARLHVTAMQYFIRLDERRVDRIPTVFAEDRRGDEALEDAAVSVKRTNHLTPDQELAHLLCKLPQFLLRHNENRLY